MSLINEEDGFDDPLDFNQVSFQKIDEHLRCPICKELLNATMMLNTCSHSFCALCIRRSLNTEQLCPKCRKPAYESNLIHNYNLDDVVITWRDSRKLLLTIDKAYTKPSANQSNIQQPKIQPNNNDLEDNLYQPSKLLVIDNDDTDDFEPPHLKSASSLNQAPTRRSTRIRKSTTQNEAASEILHEPLSQNSQESGYTVNSKFEDLQVNQPQLYQPQASCSPLQPNNLFAGNSMMYDTPTNQSQVSRSSGDANQKPHELKTTTMVECPICIQQMKYNVLDRHIDRCLQGDSRIPPDPTPIPSTSSNLMMQTSSSSSPVTINSSKMKVPAILKRQQKPVDLGKKPVKLVYSMLSDKELRDYLRALNLPDHGDKAQKIWRHKEYINLYNANHDSQNPVSAQVLVQRLQTIENSQMAEKANQQKRKVMDIESHKTKYADHFENLIASAKKTKPNK